MLINLLLIQVIVVMVTDISGFFNHFEEWLGEKLKGKVHLKILECSTCQCWWLCLLYLLCTRELSLPLIAFSLFLAVMTKITADAIYMVRDGLLGILRKINRLIE